MRPFPKFREKLPKLSRIANRFLKVKIKPPKSEAWEILPDESAEHLLRPKPPEEEEISWYNSGAPDTFPIVGAIAGSTDSLATFLDPSRRVRLDPGKPIPLAGDTENNDHSDILADHDAGLSFVVPHQERVLSDGALALLAAHNFVQSRRSPSSLNSDVPTLLNPFDMPSSLPRTLGPNIHDVDFAPPEPLQDGDDAIRSVEHLDSSESVSFITRDFADSAKDLDSERLAFPSSTKELGTWTEEALIKYKANPDHDTPFRQFVHRQHIVEWRRYRVRRTFVTAQHRGEYLVVKVQDVMDSEIRFLYLDRLIQPKDAYLWRRRDNLQDWLKCVETEGCFDLKIDPHVTVAWSRKEPPESRDLRLIFGLWTPYDRIMMLEDWPRDDVKREGHVFEPDDQPDLLDLFIAARAVHLDANFSMFRRQDHWFTKMLSRVLNQKWDKDDALSVTDKKKFDQKNRLQKGKWDRSPVSDLRHKEVLKLRNHCNKRRKLVFVASMDQALDVQDVQDRLLARSIHSEVNDKEGVKFEKNTIRNVADGVKLRILRKLRKLRQRQFERERGFRHGYRIILANTTSDL